MMGRHSGNSHAMKDFTMGFRTPARRGVLCRVDTKVMVVLKTFSRDSHGVNGTPPQYVRARARAGTGFPTNFVEFGSRQN